MRACRVIRLFGRFSELKKMVVAVSASILAVMHSFLIFILVMSICARPLLSSACVHFWASIRVGDLRLGSSLVGWVVVG